LFDELATVDAEAWHKVLKFIPEYGRWDDLIECGLDADIVALIKQQLDSDAESMAKGESVSLLAKWLPSENTSSRDTQHKAKALATALGLKSSQYRK
jgi:hypothetical protein